MVEVTKRRRAVKVFKAVCKGCHSSLSFTRGEAKEVSKGLLVTCPECNAEVWKPL